MMEGTNEHRIEIKTEPKPLSLFERNIYRQLYQDALNGNWEPEAYDEEILCRTKITKRDEIALHVAVAAGKVNFVEQLVKMMTYKDLDIRNAAGNTAFCLAAASGNMELAQVMMKEDDGRNVVLAMTRGRNNELPLYMAASQGHRLMAQHLYKLTKHSLENESYDKQEIFVTLIHAGIYDVALTMLKEDKTLVTARNRREETALHVLAQKSCLSADILRPKHQHIWKRCTDYHSLLSKISQEKSMHEKATELVESIWNEIVQKDDEEITRLIETPWRLIFVAAEKGNVEFLSILIRSYPDLIFKVDVSRYTIFHIAVKHRQEEIFKLIHEFGSTKDLITPNKDDERNNILHLAAKLPSTITRLHVVPGPALQLQRELIWFEEVKKVVQVLPLLEATNEEELTPEALLRESHEKLKKQGEDWMRGTADKCMLVATLIATVVFAAAFTVPGGNRQEDGIPVYLRNIAFKVFALSDALSLISSVASVLSFLGIMTSRYQLYDFYWSLPHKFIIGLATLFISVVAMLVAFATTLFLVFNHGNGLIWFAIPIAVAACVPATVFIWMHLSLLKDMIKQTYNPKSIFKPTKVPLSFVPLSLVPQVAVIKSD